VITFSKTEDTTAPTSTLPEYAPVPQPEYIADDELSKYKPGFYNVVVSPLVTYICHLEYEDNKFEILEKYDFNTYTWTLTPDDKNIDYKPLKSDKIQYLYGDLYRDGENQMKVGDICKYDIENDTYLCRVTSVTDNQSTLNPLFIMADVDDPDVDDPDVDDPDYSKIKATNKEPFIIECVLYGEDDDSESNIEYLGNIDLPKDGGKARRQHSRRRNCTSVLHT